MASDPQLVKRLGDAFAAYPDLEARRLFGGVCFTLNGNMCIGVHNRNLIIRVGLPTADALMKEPHIRPMDLTGKIMKGWATVLPEGIQQESDLLAYTKLAYDFVETLPRK